MNTLFPVKLITLIHHLDSRGVLQKLEEHVLPEKAKRPEDGLVRLVLCSPSIHKVIEDFLPSPEYRFCRKRFAVPPANPHGSILRAREARLELYSGEGELIGEPFPLTDLPTALTLAIEAELMGELLKTFDVNIPFM